MSQQSLYDVLTCKDRFLLDDNETKKTYIFDDCMHNDWVRIPSEYAPKISMVDKLFAFSVHGLGKKPVENPVENPVEQQLRKPILLHRLSSQPQATDFISKHLDSYLEQYSIILLLVESLARREVSSMLQYTEKYSDTFDILSTDRIFKTKDVSKLKLNSNYRILFSAETNNASNRSRDTYLTLPRDLRQVADEASNAAEDTIAKSKAMKIRMAVYWNMSSRMSRLRLRHRKITRQRINADSFLKAFPKILSDRKKIKEIPYREMSRKRDEYLRLKAYFKGIKTLAGELLSKTGYSMKDVKDSAMKAKAIYRRLDMLSC